MEHSYRTFVRSAVSTKPGQDHYAWEADEGANTLTLAIRQTAAAPAYLCGM